MGYLIGVSQPPRGEVGGVPTSSHPPGFGGACAKFSGLWRTKQTIDYRKIGLRHCNGLRGTYAGTEGYLVFAVL
jgi:hypothetical protein